MNNKVTKPLRVLVVSRLFTGLADSLAEGTWQPSGVPAVYKLIDVLAQDPNFETRFVFACKDESTAEHFSINRSITVRGLGTVRILGWRQRPWLKRLGLGGKLREVSHLMRCLILYFRFRPHVTYFTNANIVAAGIFSRLGLGRVVLRLLGLNPVQKAIADAPGGLMRWIYRSPFAYVICTLDGSGSPHYLPRLLRPGVPISIELNGVDWVTPTEQDVTEFRERFGLGARPVVMFIGRLEQTKGCGEFVDGLVHLLQTSTADGVVVGYGDMESDLRERISKAGLTDSIHVIGRVPHKEIPTALAAADIYVSLNRFGNLSNTNLEAMSQGKCMFILDNDLDTHVDEETVDLLPADIFPRISRTNTAEDLARQVAELLRDPARIERMAAETAAVGRSMLSNWTDRIDREIGLIRGTIEP
jgi:glycosyltransferase involved in cell wall biosynthesis